MADGGGKAGAPSFTATLERLRDEAAAVAATEVGKEEDKWARPKLQPFDPQLDSLSESAPEPCAKALLTQRALL